MIQCGGVAHVRFAVGEYSQFSSVTQNMRTSYQLTMSIESRLPVLQNTQFRSCIVFLVLCNTFCAIVSRLDILSLLLLLLLLLLSLAPQPSLGLGLLHKIQLNFLEASQQFSFLQGRVVSPAPNPHPGGPGLCIYIPQRQGGYPF
jgi:hypothetical protein